MNLQLGESRKGPGSQDGFIREVFQAGDILLKALSRGCLRILEGPTENAPELQQNFTKR